MGTLLFGLFILGSHPASANLFHPPLDKIVHFFVFGLLAIALQLTLPNLKWFVIVLIATAIAAADELHQFLVPGRQPGWDDGFADLLGACFGLAAWQLNPWKTR